MSSQHQGPPYAPQIWGLGGIPVKNVDIPATAVFLVLFIIGAVIHMTILQLNGKRGHKFLFNGVLFGFCMSRIVTCTLRISSISLPTNIRLSIAAAIFVAAGVLLVFIINLIWAHRLLRSLHPHIGWARSISVAFKAIYVLTFLTLATNITATVQSLYTLDPYIRKIDRSLTLYGATYLAVLSSLPILIVLGALLAPRRAPIDRFGSGRLRTQVIILLTGTTLATLGAWFRCATLWQTPVSRSQPLPGYFHKACFYIFNFSIEVIIVYYYAIMRVDLRFHVPNGAQGPRSYEKQANESTDEEKDGNDVVV